PAAWAKAVPAAKRIATAAAAPAIRLARRIGRAASAEDPAQDLRERSGRRRRRQRLRIDLGQERDLPVARADEEDAPGRLDQVERAARFERRALEDPYACALAR